MAATDEQVAANVASALADHDDAMIEQLAKSAALYSTAMEQTRKQSFDAAKESFESLLAITPQLEKAWIAYAQVSIMLHASANVGCCHRATCY
jgi:predicted Zn-dependent protease